MSEYPGFELTGHFLYSTGYSQHIPGEGVGGGGGGGIDSRSDVLLVTLFDWFSNKQKVFKRSTV